jgi:hypothetical protein
MAESIQKDGWELKILKNTNFIVHQPDILCSVTDLKGTRKMGKCPSKFIQEKQECVCLYKIDRGFNVNV